jgi:antirestriction protein ArdC
MNAAQLTAYIEQTLETLAIQTAEARQSEQFLAYLRSCARFHAYSFGNLMLILWQKPSATQVAGYRTWQRMNRYVRKGEKGIAILAPCIFKDKDDETKNRIWFKTVYVFDISQTEGEPLPEIDWRTTEQNAELQAALTALVAANGWEVSYTDDLEGAEGMCRYQSRMIALLKGTGTSTLIHEIGHMLLHADQQGMSRQDKETEAESVSYVVCTHFGIETAAPMYLAGWSDPKQIKEHAERIIKTAHRIIESVQPSVSETDD